MFARLRELARRYWQVLRRPSVHFSLGFLTIGGFIAGVVFWGAFNTALEATNTEAFCTSCHEMRDNVFQELKHPIHYSNRSGVRATRSEEPQSEIPSLIRHSIGVFCLKKKTNTI